jgi:hypothetical protein
MLLSIKILINQRDPVSAISLLANGNLLASSIAFINPKMLKLYIEKTNPAILVRTFSCGTGLPWVEKCHDMRVYRKDIGCATTPSSSNVVVRGTTVHGKGAVEPPPPC